MTTISPPALPRFAVMASLLGLFSMISLLATDMYLPALPDMVADLGSTQARAQATLIVFFLGVGVSQIVAGPLSDRYGRRPVILAATGVFGVASVACALVASVEALILMRLIQALAAGALVVLPRAITMDAFRGARATQLIGIITIVTAASPMLAPLAGSGILVIGDWRSIFWVIGGLAGVTALLGMLLLPETATPSPQSTKVVAATARKILRDGAFLRPALISAMAFVCFAVMITAAPFVYITQYGLSPTGFGLAFGANALGFVLAAGGGGALVDRLGPAKTLRIGKGVFLGVSGTLCLASLALSLPLWVVILGLSGVLFGLGLVLPTATVLALEDFTATAGLASSLIGALQMLVGALAAAALAVIFDGSFTLMIAAITLSAVCAALISTRRPG